MKSPFPSLPPSLRLLLAAAVSLAPATLRAEVPHLINYQGRIATDGVNFDGSGQFKFALVDGATGQAYWTSSADLSPQDGIPDAPVSLPVSRGLYSITLGDTAIPGMAAIPAAVFTHGDVRLRVWFSDGGAHGWEQFTPDQRLAAVGYALVAETVPDGAITAAKLATSSVTATALAPGAVTNAALATGAVKLPQLDLTSVTPAALGAETPAGSQAKIDASVAATLGTYGGMAALKTTLAQGRMSAAIHIISDSTNYGGTWSRSVALALGQLYPAYTVRTTEWAPGSTSTQWSAPVILQQGNSDPDLRHWEFPAGALYCPFGAPQDFPMPPGDLDIRARVKIGNNSATANMLFSKADNGGRLGFRIWQGAASQNRAFFLDYSTDGLSLQTVSSTAGVTANGVTDGSPYWARATMKLNSGAGTRTFTFYTSADGVTWTQLGAPVTATGALPLAGGNANCYLGGWGGSVNFTGSIYAAEIHNGIDGPTTHPLNVDLWNFNSGSAVLKGAPDLWISNAAWPGASLDNYNATTTAYYCRNYTPQIILISMSHNDAGESSNYFINKMKTLVASVRGIYGDIPKIIFVTQNPELRISAPNDPGSVYQDVRSTHRATLMSWANGAGYGIIDTWAAFLSDPRPIELLVGGNWPYTSITSITGNGSTVTVNVPDMTVLGDADSIEFAIVGATLPGGGPSHYNGAWFITGKSGNTSGPGWVTFASPLTEPVVLTGATTSRTDGVHPSGPGYALWASVILQAFKRGTP